jgi:hypothetical protein
MTKNRNLQLSNFAIVLDFDIPISNLERDLLASAAIVLGQR